MSRYGIVTWSAIGVASLLFIALPIPKCTWAVAGVWAVYVPIFVGGMGFIRWQFFGPAVCRGKAENKTVALTFDDGPDPAGTPRLLELLERENIRATFFCVGRQVDAHPEVAKQIVDAGHLLANHSYGHPWYISMMREERLAEELRRGQNSIEAATGVTCRFFRPPSGMTSRHFPAVLREVGLTLVGWDVRSLDTFGSAQGAIDRILRQTRDGSIILMHDGGMKGERLIEIVGTVIRELRSRGFEFERVDRMVETQSAGKSMAPMGSLPVR